MVEIGDAEPGIVGGDFRVLLVRNLNFLNIFKTSVVNFKWNLKYFITFATL